MINSILVIINQSSNQWVKLLSTHTMSDRYSHQWLFQRVRQQALLRISTRSTHRYHPHPDALKFSRISPWRLVASPLSIHFPAALLMVEETVFEWWSEQDFEEHVASCHHGLNEVHWNFANIQFGSSPSRHFLIFVGQSDLQENRFLTPLQWLRSKRLLGFVEGNIGRQNLIPGRINQSCHRRILELWCLRRHVERHNHPWCRWPCRRAPYRPVLANSIMERMGRRWIISFDVNLISILKTCAQQNGFRNFQMAESWWPKFYWVCKSQFPPTQKYSQWSTRDLQPISAD